MATKHVAPEKLDQVKKFVELMIKYPIIGAVDMENLPTRQLQNMRASLRGNVELLVGKRRLMKLAIEKAKDKRKDIDQLIPHLKGMPGLLFTNENPFTLYKKLKKSKSSAPAKGGQTAPKDIIIKAGVTPFAPGPVIGELGAIGLKVGVEGGKVAVKEDKVVVKEGEIIKPAVASILTRLGIEPMEIGLNVVAVYQDGTIFQKSVLDVDEDAYVRNITQAAQWAFNLAVEAAYPTQETTIYLIQKAFKESKALAVSRNILEKEVVGEILAKAHQEMQSVKSVANIQD